MDSFAIIKDSRNFFSQANILYFKYVVLYSIIIEINIRYMKAFGNAVRESVPPGAMTGLKEFLDGVHPRGNREYVIA